MHYNEKYIIQKRTFDLVSTSSSSIDKWNSELWWIKKNDLIGQNDVPSGWPSVKMTLDHSTIIILCIILKRISFEREHFDLLSTISSLID